jgi:hypothetical protein
MKKTLLFLLCICVRVHGITYDQLVEIGRQTGATDYVPHFRKIFDQMKVKTMLEFGYGLSTEYFLEKCTKVFSVEFVTHGCGPEGVKNYLQLFSDKSNWIPITYFTGYHGDTNWAPFKYFGTDKIYKAISYHCATSQNYALIDPTYLNELHEFISNLAKSNKIDVALVNTTAFIRGDLVQLLFGKAPIIIGHCTYARALGQKDDVYGYSRVKTPDNYEEIYLSEGSGSTIWISKAEKYQPLIELFKK